MVNIDHWRTSDRPLTRQQFRDILQVSDSTSFRLLRSGTVKNVKIGRNFRILPEDLAKFLDEGVDR